MALYFLDSSAVVKRYVKETGTDWIAAITDISLGNQIHLARITGVEVIAALTRRSREGSLTSSETINAITQFRADFYNEYFILDITPALISSAMQLAEKHALRAYDAVQLAAAFDVNAQGIAIGMPEVTLVSADGSLNTAAVAEGLIIENPNDHP